MFRTNVPWRVVAASSALVAIGLFVHFMPSEHEAETPTLTPPAATMLQPTPLPIAAREGSAPYFDIVDKLGDIGIANARAMPAAEQNSPNIPAAGTCERPKQLRARLAAWIDKTYSDEKPGAKVELEFRVGCTERDGAIVAMNVDREKKTGGLIGRWWIVRVGADAITVLQERTSTAKINWMEWADEGTLGVLGLVDLDGDSVRDVLWTRTEHEGGSSQSNYAVSATLSKSGTTESIFAMRGRLETWVTGGDVVLAMSSMFDEHVAYRCVTNRKVSPCAASDRARIQAEKALLADKYNSITASEVPDRDALAEDLAKLGVPAKESAPILAAAVATSAEQRAQRDVARFLATLRPVGELSQMIDSPTVLAQVYFDKVRTELGDSRCEPTAIDHDRVNAWIAKQGKATNTMISPGCGPYVWAAWDIWSKSSGVRHEALLAIGDDITRVVAFESEATGDPMMGPATAQSSTFYRRGDTVLGLVIHFLADRNEVLAIADGRVVGKRKGAFERYTFDVAYSDSTDNLVVDRGANAWWHATPTGLERVRPAALIAHEAQRAAIELLRSYEPHSAVDYVRALKTLGANRALVRQVAILAGG